MHTPCSFRRFHSRCFSLFGFIAMIVLQGCSGGMGNQTPAPLALQGMVRGGQQPVFRATIQLYAAEATGYGGTAIPLLIPAVTTGTGGKFTLTNLYTCPTPDTQVYIVATGGNPGLGVGTNNTGLAMMSALGSCKNLSASTYIIIDEVSTVASVYALAPFMGTGGGTNMGTGTTNLQGLANAFATVNNLIDTSKGQGPGPNLPAGATAPSAEINTLADIISACVNSNGSTGECSSLFTAATPNGGTAPTNTIDAILDIAQNPVNNTTMLYDLLPGTPPFQPILPPVPHDWTMALTYTGGGLNNPYGIAIDASGNVWAPNTGSGNLTELSSTGVAVSPAGGFTGGLNIPHQVAIDSLGNVWVGNQGNNSLSEFSSAGVQAMNSPFTGGGLNVPSGIAVDTLNNIFVANQGASTISEFANDGTPVTPTGYTGSSLDNPSFLAIDTLDNLWIANFGSSSLSEFTTTGVQETPTAYIGGGLAVPNIVAIDHTGNLWLTNVSANVVSKFNSSGVAQSGVAGFSVGASVVPDSSGLGIDGNDNVWTANVYDNSISELANDGTLLSGATGYKVVGLDEPTTLAIDGSGNIWVTDYLSNSITEVVGAAAPVTTPLVQAVINDAIGVRPQVRHHSAGRR